MMFQGCLISILIKKICFLKEVKNQLVEILIQPVVLHLVFLKTILKTLTLFGFVIKKIQSIDLCFQLIDFLKTLTQFS